MACPRCESENIVTRGFYVTKNYGMRRRFKCKDCSRMFIVLPSLKDISSEQIKEILRLSKRVNPHASKYDHRKTGSYVKGKTYSSREIAKITGVNANTIVKIIRRESKVGK